MTDWIAQLQLATAQRGASVTARTFHRRWSTASRPVLLTCDDNQDYVVKGLHAGRALVNDQIVGWLGRALGAPVGQPCLVYIPVGLQNIEQQMADVSPGLSHGSRWITGCSERNDTVMCNEAGNLERFALLAVLFGWCQGNDQQFIYANQSPHLAYSVDHGFFFSGGPDWTIASLSNARPPRPESNIMQACNGSDAALQLAIDRLKQIDDHAIVKAVAAPPDEWKISIDERVALLEYLIQRRNDFHL